MSLFKTSCPTAIPRGISLVVVDALQCSTRWPLAHVREKAQESLPPFAYRDATASVIRKHPVVRAITTPIHHGAPRSVCASRPSNCPAVLKISSGKQLEIPTSATRGLPHSQMIARNGFLFSAVAAANPRSFVPRKNGRTLPQNKKPSEALPSKIKNRHVVILTCGRCLRTA